MSRYDLIREWCELRNLQRMRTWFMRRGIVRGYHLTAKQSRARRREIEQELGFRPKLKQWLEGGYNLRIEKVDGDE